VEFKAYRLMTEGNGAQCGGPYNADDEWTI
jgi:hypothetical protein